MFADWLLKLAGENPAAYSTLEDKWTYIFLDYKNGIFLVLSLFFALIPWIFFKRKSFSKHDVIIKVSLSAGIFVVAELLLALAEIFLNGYGSQGGIF